MGSYYRVCEAQNSGTGANMHFSSNLRPYYFIPSTGRPLPLRGGDVTWMGRNGYTDLAQPSSFNHYAIYEKEIIRQAMINHEAAFRYQVHELHRLHERQKELMAEHRMREIAAHQLSYQRSQSDRLVYPIQPISQMTVPPWHSVNAETYVSSLHSDRYLQRPSFAGDSLQSDNISFLTKLSRADNEGLPPQINKFGKRMIDLELPADLYTQSDEEDNSICKNIADVPPMLHSPANETRESNLESFQHYPFDTTGSLNINSSSGGTKLCIDLNEPIQLDDESYSSCHLNSTSWSTQTVHLSPVPSREPVNESKASIGDNVLNVISPEEKQVEHQPLSSEAGSDEVILVQKSSAKGTSLGSNISCGSHDSPKTVGTCISCSPQLVSHAADSDFKALSSVTSQIRSSSDLREVPSAVQALPCFKTTNVTKGPKSAYASSRTHSDELLVKKKTSANNADIGKEPFQVDRRLPKRMKNSHDRALLEHVDLNCMPLDFETLPGNDCEDYKAPHSSDITMFSSFDDQPPLPFPTSCKSVPSMSDDNEEVGDNALSSQDIVSVKNDEINLAKDSNFKRLSCSKDLTSHFDEDEPPAASSQSATAVKLHGTKDLNIGTPVSPENIECHPPRGKSEDTFEIPLYVPKEDKTNVGELDKIAAEAMCSMSSSRESMTPKPSRLLDNCLNWFAGIASSVSEDLCDEIKEHGNKSAGSDDRVNLKTRKVRVRRTKDSSCRGKKQNEQSATDERLPIPQGRGRKSKQLKILKEKSLNSIEMGRRIDVVAFDSIKKRKRNKRNIFSKQRLCSAKTKNVGNCLHGWGLRACRRKARRARRVFDVFLHHLFH